MSWIPSSPGSVIDQIRGAVSALTEPFLDIFRRFIPGGGAAFSMDFSPVVAIIVLDVIKRIL